MRSARPATCNGFDGATAISSEFFANTVGVVFASFALVTVAIVAALAAAKTSTGEPATICAANVSEPPNDGTIFTPGCAVSKLSANEVKVFFSDAAAKTTTVPVIAAAEADVAPPPACLAELHPAKARVERVATANVLRMCMLLYVGLSKATTGEQGFPRPRSST